ncbi:MAG: flagellum-specific ATP synthase FliI, partial [Oscillospiraceae bacterium]
MKINDTLSFLPHIETYSHMGKVKSIVGMMLEATGITAAVGEICIIKSTDRFKGDTLAEVAGFRDDKVLLMVYDDIKGVAPGSLVIPTKNRLRVPVGDFLIG